ncbi:MAG: ATP-binding protein [Candidatus Omnitrophica bacterium]|nr:ATP-binding protein [Candidatus Omnitrophota bacterium]
MPREKISEIVKEAENLHSLIEKLLKCVSGLSGGQCSDLMGEIGKKLEQFKIAETSLSQRAIHSERLAVMGQMAAAISHELRNPLSGIKVAAEYLMRKLKDQPDAMDVVMNIHNEVIFADTIITNILEHARIGKPHCEKASIKKLIEEAVLTIQQQGLFNTIEIKREISDALPLLELDVMQIRQVLMNLFINSAEAMLGKGSGGVLRIEAVCDTDQVTVRVSDTGSGIEKSHLEKICEPFFSTKVRGIGLGLAIAKEIIENHNGTLTIESRVGKGTTVILRFPIPSAE